MSALLTSMLICNFYMKVNSLGSRDGILTATYSEILKLNQNGIDYFNEPVIITDSIQSNWTLLPNLENIFDENYTISSKRQTTNCSCLMQTDIYNKMSDKININNLCEHYGQALQYVQTPKNYLYWEKFVGKHKLTSEGIDCTSVEEVELPIREGIIETMNEESYFTPQMTKTSNTNRDTITTTRTYHFLMGFDPIGDKDSETLAMSELQLSTMDHITLSPFFHIFKTNRFSSFKSIQNMNIWYSSEYYRAIRHYDALHNLFFVLKGSRNFRLSKPTSTVFDLYPYLHASKRHQIANYPQIETYSEGVEITNTSNYTVHDCTVYENEVLYLPGYWFHEVINDNITIVLNIWWDSKDQQLSDNVHTVKLPTHPDPIMRSLITYHKAGKHAALYFVQSVIHKWCNYIENHSDRNNYGMRCMNENYKGFGGFLQYNFMSTYKIILSDLTFDNFEWYSIGIDTSDILKCVKTHVVDFHDLRDLKTFMYTCRDIGYNGRKFWDKSVNDVMTILEKSTNIGIGEINLVQYLETVLAKAFGDSNIIPIIIKLMNL